MGEQFATPACMAKKKEDEQKSETADKKAPKLNIKNKQIAKALDLKGIKAKLTKKKTPKEKEPSVTKGDEAEVEQEEAPKIKARSKSVFAESEQVEKAPEPAAPTVTEEAPPPVVEEVAEAPTPTPVKKEAKKAPPAQEKLGPTGKHVKDLIPKKPKPAPEKTASEKKPGDKRSFPPPSPPREDSDRRTGGKKASKGSKYKEFRDFKSRPFSSRDRAAASGYDEGYGRYRKKRPKLSTAAQEELTVRPTEVKVRIPISIKDLAAEMKLKASQLIAELLKHGLMLTINDALDDETAIQLVGEGFGCKIEIDTSEEDLIRVTDQSIAEEIASAGADQLQLRAPIVAFMGHVDHGKTSLIDSIRKSNVASGEAGAITQHIGAFRCHTKVGDIAILDTPGHEAFTEMRLRGATLTDIVVLVVAGDEGIKPQTVEAINHAKEADVTIVVAINKSDKPNFDADNVYRQLSEIELLPEAWGGETITVNCSAVTGDGIPDLLEMLALQAEVLELKANPNTRARGTVVESEMHKGLGAVSTILIQNGTLELGNAIIADTYYGRIKTMRDEHGKQLKVAPPSTPVEVTGLSGLPDAGSEFIVIDSEKEAREISEARMSQVRLKSMQRKPATLESMLEDVAKQEKKIFNLMICADVQGSMEALITALSKIKSDKVDLNIVSSEVGEVSESNIQLANASSAVILGFHTKVESHAEPLAKELGVKILLHDIIYHAVDEVKELMRQTLDKLSKESDTGAAEVRQVFKSSQLGQIAGCIVSEGTIHRNHSVRVKREGEEIWKGPISSLKRVKEDVKEIQKGFECGILLNGFSDYQVGDILEAFEITYYEQEL